MVAHELPMISENPMQDGLALDHDAGLLVEFAPDRIIGGLAALDAAPRQYPPWRVAVLHEEHAALAVYDDRPHAQSRPSRQSEPGMQRKAGNHSEKDCFCHRKPRMAEAGVVC